MSKIVFNLESGKYFGLCANCKIVEIIQFNIDGKGSFLYIGDGKIRIALFSDLTSMLVNESYTWNNRKYKIDEILSGVI